MDKRVIVFFYDKDGGVSGLRVNLKVYNITDLIYVGEYLMEDFRDGLYIYNFNNCDISKDYYFIAYVRQNNTGRVLESNFAIGDSVNFKLDFVYNVEGGEWKIDKDRKEMIFYDVGGNELMRFKLYDVNGRPNISAVGYRKKV